MINFEKFGKWSVLSLEMLWFGLELYFYVSEKYLHCSTVLFEKGSRGPGGYWARRVRGPEGGGNGLLVLQNCCRRQLQ